MTGASQPHVLAADAAGIAEAAQILRNGGIVAVPTETVYGLAARADSDQAVAEIFRAKGRPDFNPLIVHVADIDGARRLARFDASAELVAQAFWPGALTLVLPRLGGAALSSAVTAGLTTVALRSPSHPVMRAVLAAAGVPLAAPSANRSGALSPTSAVHVAASLGGNIDCIIDGGACEAGIESTIIAQRASGSWELLRPGPITEDQIARHVGALGDATSAGKGKIEAPGQLSGHYSPGKPLRLNAQSAQPDEFHIGFRDITGSENLSSTGDLALAAAQLYAVLHRAAASDKLRIAVAPIPDHGLGTAINERLRRAAAA
ncbi:MAG: L-threonylcarbamoyladenylate synthase [Novosphingobium sp.]|nr:L-threonylcarbamoyladenylate synthase [Novosphingobium sp.]